MSVRKELCLRQQWRGRLRPVSVFAAGSDVRALQWGYSGQTKAAMSSKLSPRKITVSYQNRLGGFVDSLGSVKVPRRVEPGHGVREPVLRILDTTRCFAYTAP